MKSRPSLDTINAAHADAFAMLVKGHGASGVVALLAEYADARRDSAKAMHSAPAADDFAHIARVLRKAERDMAAIGARPRTTRRTKPPTFTYSSTDAIFSVYKHSEGGAPIAEYLATLHDAGIPAVRVASGYVGQVGIRVARKHAKRAERLLFG